MNFYNEFDPKAAAWLRELIRWGLIPPGDVDERSITEIKPHELAKYTQCHFFAGIGGWSLAFKLAGWPVDRPAGSGSCPCQPFSGAGKGLGVDDPRHLWPVLFKLIAQCRSLGQRWAFTFFGEQVASKAGRNWLAGVRDDLEGVGYAVGGADLCAPCTSPEVAGWIWIPDETDAEGGGWIPVSAGAPHIRQRLYWVAYANGERCDGEQVRILTGGSQQGDAETSGRCRVSGLADANGGDAGAEREQRSGEHGQQPEDGGADRLEHPASDRREQRGTESGRGGAVSGCGIGADTGRLVYANSERGCGGITGPEDAADAGLAGEAGGFWGRYDFLPCTDGKTRRVEPESFPLAHGVSGRVGLLRGYGNAIVPQVAAAFILSCEEARLP